MATARPPYFQRGIEYIAVRPIKETSKSTIEPGKSVMHLREFHLRELFRRRRIGPIDHPWTEAMLGDQKTYAKPEVEGVIPKAEPVNLQPVVIKSPEPVEVDGQLIEPPSQNDEGDWEVGVAGEKQAYSTLEAALDTWRTLIGETDEEEQSAADEDTANEASDNSGNETPKDPAENSEASDTAENSAKAEKPEPQKEGSQWVIEGVEGKFPSKKKAVEAWEAAQTTEDDEDFLK